MLRASLFARRSLVRSFASSTLTLDNISSKVVNSQYAVRGELVLRAEKYRLVLRADKYSKELKKADHGLPFNQLMWCNIGNPQQMKQKPLTFHRQVISSLVNPGSDLSQYPEDVGARAQMYLSLTDGTGAYTDSQGIEKVREEVAGFVAERDGVPAQPENIFLTDGASSGVKALLSLMVSDERDCILCPTPQYPLYSAALALLGGSNVPYYLDESNGWGLSTDELERALSTVPEGSRARALVVINPGNPTGQCLDEANMRDIVSLCDENNLVLMADEVYQENVYAPDKEFVSFKKVVAESGSDVELVSFHSCSKGFIGECGVRGGYFELHNFDPDVQAQILKLVSINLCSNTVGQFMTGLMVNPPKEGDASHSLYVQERDAILDSLRVRAEKVSKRLNDIDGISCNTVEGALYAFPTIRVPPLLTEAALKAGEQPDFRYCSELLDQTGIVAVPGSGFGQVDGTYHLRMTILPPEEDVDHVLDKLSAFHKSLK